MNIVDKSLRHIWYPCADMKDYQEFKPMYIKRAYGSYIEMEDGKKVIDAISSWWCKSLGHGHPDLKAAIIEQLHKFEHVMQPHTTNDVIANLSEELSGLTKNLKKVFYASDGSTVVEIALKMALHAQKILGHEKKNKFIALSSGYHGETLAALSVSDLGKYKTAYNDLLFETFFIQDIPYVNGIEGDLWKNCYDHWEKTERKLEPYQDQLAAIILEPIVQGASGMKIYSQDFLKNLSIWAKKRGIYLIADEIMTGIGRTGKMLACDHANIEPDLLCLSKGLTSGMLPLSACLVSQEIYDVFYNKEPFLHSNTHYGNALGASVALIVLKIFKQDSIIEKASKLNMGPMMQKIADETGLLTNVRSIGAIAAADLVNVDSFKLYKKSMEMGAILRPINNSLYWTPPLNIENDVLEDLSNITKLSLLESFL